jgi:hypothetical protein
MIAAVGAIDDRIIRSGAVSCDPPMSHDVGTRAKNYIV